MYNMIFGTNSNAGNILALLDLKPEDIGRFRDAFITEDGLAIYTRLGGGNRECWKDENGECSYCYHQFIERLQGHPLYVSDVDDYFDSTYATFMFRFPEEYRAELEAIAQGIHFDPSERWLALLERLKEASRNK